MYHTEKYEDKIMKKIYMTPSMKTGMLDSQDSILLTASKRSIEMGDAFGDGEEGTADIKEEKRFGKNLWDELW